MKMGENITNRSATSRRNGKWSPANFVPAAGPEERQHPMLLIAIQALDGAVQTAGGIELRELRQRVVDGHWPAILLEGRQGEFLIRSGHAVLLDVRPELQRAGGNISVRPVSHPHRRKLSRATTQDFNFPVESSEFQSDSACISAVEIRHHAGESWGEVTDRAEAILRAYLLTTWPARAAKCR